jgi:hypothetical protein
VPQRLLDLAGEQLAVPAEVPLEGVAVDDDPVLVAFRRHPVAKILAIGVALMAEVRDHDRHPLEDALEFLRQGVDRVGDQGFEAVRLGLIHSDHVNQQPRESLHMTRKLRAVGPALAVIAIAAGGVVWSGCGSGSDTDSITNQAKEEIEAGTKKAEEAAREAAEKSKKAVEEAREQVEKNKGNTSKKIEKAAEEAEKGIEEGKAQAEKGLEEAKQEAEKYLP